MSQQDQNANGCRVCAPDNAVDIQAARAERKHVFGKVGVNSAGRVGVITDYADIGWGPTYIGHNIDDGKPWAGRFPSIIADSVADIIKRREEVARLFAVRDAKREALAEARQHGQELLKELDAAAQSLGVHL